MVEVQSKDTGFLFASEKGIIGKLLGEPQSQIEQCPSKEPQLETRCPDCGSYNINRNGFRYITNQRETQVFKCKECGLRFSEKYYRCIGQHRSANYALNKEAKKLDAVTENKTVTSDAKNKLAEHHLNMKINGYAEATIKMSWNILELLVRRGADLDKSDTVKLVISQQNWGGNRKRNVINAYSQYLKYLGKTWEEPKCNITRKIPFIPTEQEVDDLIAGCYPVVAVFVQLLKETGMRSGEAIQLLWKDVDLERYIITCNTPEKNSNPRMFNNLSSKLLNMLNNLPRKSDNVFGVKTLNGLKADFTRCRSKQAFKLGNPRLKEIHFHTLRHWKATMLYHQTKDILFVKQFLGHKSIDNTELYIQLDKQLFQGISEDTFIIKVVSTVEEATKLGEVGFEPYLVIQGVQLMRKRK
jgi:integrase